MALDFYSYPFEGQQTSEAEYSRLLDAALGGSGLLEAPGFTIAGMTFTATGIDGIARGHRFKSASGTLALESTAGARTALIGARLDYTGSPKVKSFVKYQIGTGLPYLVQTTEGIYEVPIWSVLIPANASSLGPSQVTTQWTRLRSPSASYVFVQPERPSNPPVNSIRIW